MAVLNRKQLPLALAPDLPPGVVYVREFLNRETQSQLVALASSLDYSEVRMHGVAARRRVAHFGVRYGYESWKLEAAAPIPDALVELRERVAPIAPIQPEKLAEALVTWYPHGAGIGWHQDAPAFGTTVIGVSLGAACTMRFRPTGSTDRKLVRSLTLEPGSCYVITGAARSSWQHQIPPVHEERWSITFRTLAEGRRQPESL